MTKEPNHLFFELIRVSIGTQEYLSRTPSSSEWMMLYDIARKQSLLGVCFAGIQRLYKSDKENHCGMCEMLYFTWMGMTAKIQQRNCIVDERCVELQRILSTNGFQTSILKGQGVARLYGEQLRGLRQSGDIDIYVKGGMKHVLDYCYKTFDKVNWDYINAHAPFYSDTEVELHWRAQSITNLYTNRRLQKWFQQHELSMLQGNYANLECGKIVVPSIQFNAFYILLHCYHHMFESGLGLRQLMDYYFVLLHFLKQPELLGLTKLKDLYNDFGMNKFASGIIWILWHVFDNENPNSKLLINKTILPDPNESEGHYLLREIMQNGNFGHHDERRIIISNRWIQPFITRIQHNWHLFSRYPSEFFWAPVWLVYHYFWKKKKIRKYNY